MKKFVILLFLLTPGGIFSQNWNVSLANGMVQHKEELLQPIVYTGYNLSLGSNYSILLKNRAIVFADVMISGIITAKTKLGNDMSQLNTNIELGYLFNLNKAFWKTGASFQCQYNYTLYSLNYEYPFWFKQYSFNWNNKLNLIFKEKYKIELTSTIPLIGFLSRTPKEVLQEYKQEYTSAYFHDNMTLSTLNNFRALTTTAFFSLNKQKKRKLKIGYRGNYFFYKKPKPVSTLYHSFVLSVALTK